MEWNTGLDYWNGYMYLLIKPDARTIVREVSMVSVFVQVCVCVCVCVCACVCVCVCLPTLQGY